MNEPNIAESPDSPPRWDFPSDRDSAFAWARYNDATVNAMICGNATPTEIIAVLAREKANLIEIIAGLELISPKKITMDDGSVMVYRCPVHLIPDVQG